MLPFASKLYPVLATILVTGLLIVPAAAQTDVCRVYVAPDGEQGAQPATGNTLIKLLPGETARVMVWVEVTEADQVALNGYQMMWNWPIQPLAGATGMVSYVDNDPGMAGGDSILVDEGRGDWVFADSPPGIFPPAYNETPDHFFGLFAVIEDGVSVDPAGLGPVYLVEFDVQASGDALGDFELQFRRVEDGDPPLSVLLNPLGQLQPCAYQYLTIQVTTCGDGIVDDGEDCDGGVCCTEDCLFDAGTVCRPAAGPCDVAESCDGISGDCPLDDVAPAGIICAPGNGAACLADATCDGFDITCPPNPPIVDCINGDGCCPPACDGDNDDDCMEVVPPVPALGGPGMVLLLIALATGLALRGRRGRRST